MIVNRIKRKLKSNRGTSIFFGLLLFMVASILSVVMISASVTTVKRVESDRKAEQSYLTCSSAAKLLRNEIENTSVKYYRRTVTKNIETETIQTEDTPENDRWTSAGKNVTGQKSAFADFLRDYVQEFAERPTASADTLNRTYTISVSTVGTDTDSGMEPVTANCTISKAKNGNGYDIIMKMTTGATVNDCQMVVYLTGDVLDKSSKTTNIENKETIEITDNTYTWKATDVIYGDQKRTSEAS